MEGIEYEVLYDGSDYYTYKLANDILREKIAEYESIIHKSKKILQDSEDYVAELENRYVINTRQMDREHREIVHMLSESNGDIDSEYRELMNDSPFAERVKRYVVGKVRASKKWNEKERRNFEGLTWLSPKTVTNIRGMSLEDIAGRCDCIGTLLIDSENDAE